MLLALIAAAAIPPTSARNASASAAVQVVRGYYAAIQDRDYRTAHAIFGNGHSIAAMRRGYAQTVRVTVTPLPPFRTEGAAGSSFAEIRVRVDAMLRSGGRQQFTGSYTLRRVNDVEGSTMAQRRWHIVAAHLREKPAGVSRRRA